MAAGQHVAATTNKTGLKNRRPRLPTDHDLRRCAIVVIGKPPLIFMTSGLTFSSNSSPVVFVGWATNFSALSLEPTRINQNVSRVTLDTPAPATKFCGRRFRDY